MTTFDNREKAAENKFGHDAELQFKISTKRNKMAGLWAAEKMGMDAESAKSYAATLVSDTVTDTSVNAALNRIKADFLAHGLDIPNDDISIVLNEMELLAKGQVMTD